jgi:hypothetical protein
VHPIEQSPPSSPPPPLPPSSYPLRQPIPASLAQLSVLEWNAEELVQESNQ